MINWVKQFKKSKTLLFGALVALLGGVQVYLPSLQFALDPIVYGALTFTIGVVVIVLRFFTTTPVDKK